MIPNKANIDLVFRALSAVFTHAYTSAETRWEAIAMLVPSGSAIQEYPWLTKFPQMREWVGERVVEQVAAHVYRLRNRDFQAAIEIDRNDFEDDQMEMHAAAARGAGESAALWPDETVFEAVNSAFTTGLCHDGKPFFHAAHPLENADPFPNLMTKALDASSLAKAKASFGAAETMLMEMTDPEGRPLGLRPDRLLVPPALKAEANLLMTSDRLGGDDPNPYKGAATVECSARLTSKTAWSLTSMGGGGLKPFLWQLRKAAQIDMVTDPSDFHVFNTRKLLIGVHGRGEAGYTLPQLAVGSTGVD